MAQVGKVSHVTALVFFSIGGGVQDRTEDAPISRGAGSHLGAVDPDEALRVALKAAVDAGQWERVRVLTDLLASAPKGAEVVELATRRKMREPS
jgi:hypothetical protein